MSTVVQRVLGNPHLSIRKQPIRLNPDSSRVVPRQMILSPQRIQNIIHRVQAIPNDQVESILAQVEEDFGKRHRSIRKTLSRHFQRACEVTGWTPGESEERNLLMGAYLIME